MQAETRLESLKLGQLQLDPLFASDTTCYEAWSDDDYLNVSAVQWPSSAEALVYRVDSTTVEAGLLNMTSAMILDQTVTLTVTVLAQDGITEQLYTITLHNNKSAAQDASLATLTLGTHDILRASELAVLEPVFSAEMLQYLVVPPVPVESVYINCSTATRGALVEINGQITTTSSANLALTPGLTRTIQIKVSSPSGATSNYQVKVRRSDQNATLTNLRISSGMLIPSFNSDKFMYAASVNTPTVTLIPEAGSMGARLVDTNGLKVVTGSHTSPCELMQGKFTLCELNVISEDPLYSQTYVVHVLYNPGSTLSQKQLCLEWGKGCEEWPLQQY